MQAWRRCVRLRVSIQFVLEPCHETYVGVRIGSLLARRRHHAGPKFLDDFLPLGTMVSNAGNVEILKGKVSGAGLIIVAFDAVFLEQCSLLRIDLRSIAPRGGRRSLSALPSGLSINDKSGR